MYNNTSSTYNNVRCNIYNTPRHYVIISLFCLVLFQLHFAPVAGRTLGNSVSHSQDEKLSLKGHIIGSRPPRCEKRCATCDPCEAIPIPTSHLIIKDKNSHSTSASIRKVYKITYSRSDDNSNYKPISWKCKCGNIIFDP